MDEFVGGDGVARVLKNRGTATGTLRSPTLRMARNGNEAHESAIRPTQAITDDTCNAVASVTCSPDQLDSPEPKPVF